MSKTTEKETKDFKSSFEQTYKDSVTDLQDLEKQFTGTARRVTGMILEGIESWEKKRQNVSTDEKDSGFSEGVKGAQEIFSNTLKEAIDIHKDLVSSLQDKIKEKSASFTK